MYLVKTKVRSGVSIINPGTVLSVLPAGWDKDRLVRIGALEILPGETQALTQGAEDLTPPPPPPHLEEEATEKASQTAPAKPTAKPKGKSKPPAKPAAKTEKPAARASAPASGPQLPEGIDPNLAATEE